MALDPQLASQFAQTINRKALSSRDVNGAITYGAAAQLSARVTQDTRIVERPDGSTVETSHLIACKTQIAETDKVWLPGDSASNSELGRKPEQITQAVDEFGNTEYWLVRL